MEFTTHESGTVAAARAYEEIAARLQRAQDLRGRHVRLNRRTDHLVALPEIASRFGLTEAAVNRIRIRAEDTLRTLDVTG